MLTIVIEDDGKTPTLGSIGPCTVDIYTGSTNKQIFLQNLAASVDVSKASSISATINPSIGQDGGFPSSQVYPLRMPTRYTPRGPLTRRTVRGGR